MSAACIADADLSRGHDAPSSSAARTRAVDAGCADFASAFAAIQARIFAAHGCAANTCHGVQAAGGLSLTHADAHAALVGVQARGSSLRRVEPGQPDASYLYQKLKAATRPGSVAVAGSPMPIGGPALREDELEAVRAWIAAGAPESGAPSLTAHVVHLLDPCATAPTPGDAPEVRLPVPDPARGVQLRMPPYVAPPHSEWEGCIATYVDLTQTVPRQFQNAARTAFHVKSTEIRQSAGNHHLTVMPSGLGPERVHDRAFGAWTCQGGDRRGQACEPLDPASCGAEGVCASTPKAGIACFGYGPFGTFLNPSLFGLGKSPKPYLIVEPIPGVYRDVGLRGIVFWNIHAYNLTDRERVQQAELNLWYTDDLRFPEQTGSFSAPGYEGVPPFTKRDVCGSWTAPRNSTLIRLSSHTHRHGERFWMTDPKGELIYESFDYANSLYLVLDPPLVFDSPRPAERTIRYCATFNNGLRPDGSLDTELVTRRSRMPPQALSTCTPTACAAGKVGARCRGVNDHAACDSEPGRGDGLCDACPTVSGETTEHEMFIMHPAYIHAVMR